MRLLHTQTLALHEFFGPDLPPFIVLSYACQRQAAVTGPGVSSQASISKKEPPFSQSTARACAEAHARGLFYLWAFSLCVDFSSSAELDEAVNGSFRWLQRAAVCFIYLHDLPSDGPLFDQDTWQACTYWERAWTLQELIAPAHADIFDANWRFRGSRSSPELAPLLSNITGIPQGVLVERDELWRTAIAMRISWGARRHASREEDTAYSLAGIAGINMSVRYGEGAENAFKRLQQKILRNTTDGSIFAWRSADTEIIRGLLARSPADFRHFSNARGGQVLQPPWTFNGIIRQTNQGIEIQSCVSRAGPYMLMEIGWRGQAIGRCKRIGIWLWRWNSVYVRVFPSTVAKVTTPGSTFSIHAVQDIEPQILPAIIAQFHAEKQHQLESQTISARRSEASPSPANDKSRQPRSIKRDVSGKHKTLPGHIQPSSAHVPIRKRTPDTESRVGDGERNCSSSFFGGSDSEVESEYHANLNENASDNEYTLDPNHEFQKLRKGLTEWCYDRMRELSDPKKDVAMPKRRSPPFKRAKVKDGNTHSRCIREEQDTDDRELIILSYDTISCNFACPFYVVNPIAYRRCLVRYSLKSIEDVLRHLEKYHLQRPYCPACGQTFTSNPERDGHIQKRNCKLRFPIRIEGVDKTQLLELSRQDNPNRNNHERWLSLFNIAIPGTKSDHGPYINKTDEKAVSIVREFWTCCGRECVDEYLRGVISQEDWHDEAALAALRSLTLHELFDRTIQDQSATQR